MVLFPGYDATTLCCPYQPVGGGKGDWNGYFIPMFTYSRPLTFSNPTEGDQEMKEVVSSRLRM